MEYTNVVVGTDGSETAERAVHQAATFAAAVGARLIIVTAYADATTVATAEADRVPADIRHLLTDRAQAEARTHHGREIAKEVGVSKVVVQALEGNATDVLREVATDFDAELIVVGSRGLTSHAHFLLGSVASSVSHHAPCDVLVVHTTG